MPRIQRPAASSPALATGMPSPLSPHGGEAGGQAAQRGADAAHADDEEQVVAVRRYRLEVGDRHVRHDPDREQQGMERQLPAAHLEEDDRDEGDVDEVIGKGHSASLRIWAPGGVHPRVDRRVDYAGGLPGRMAQVAAPGGRMTRP